MKKYLWILALLLAMALAVSGCTYQPESEDLSREEQEEQREEQDEPEEETPGDPLQICQSFLDAYTGLDGEAVGALLTGMGQPYSFGSLTGILAENTAVELGKPEQTEDRCRIPASVETVDLWEVLKAIPDSVASQEEADAWLAGALAGENAPRKTFETEVLLVLEHGSWKVELTAGLSDALLGGYFTVLQQAAEEGAE